MRAALLYPDGPYRVDPATGVFVPGADNPNLRQVPATDEDSAGNVMVLILHRHVAVRGLRGRAVDTGWGCLEEGRRNMPHPNCAH